MKELKNQKIWICWKYVSVDGHRTKKPYAVTGIPTGTSQDHVDEWSEYSTARKALADAKLGFDGIGFIMPEGVFLLDIDHKDISDPLVQELLALFPTYMEISPSGHGYHIYGRADLSRIPKVWSEKEKRWKLDDRFYAKNSNIGLELYVGGLTNRFATFTGNTEGGPKQISDCTEAVLTFLESYMKKPEEHVSCGGLDTNRFIKFSEDQIPEIVDSLYSQRNGEKFKALYHDGDIRAYGSPSEADAALCALIAFCTGPDPEIIDAIFRQSALYRDKWDRSDYSSWTISAGIRACHGVFHKSVKVTPPFVLIEKNKEYVHPTLLADYVRKHLNYLFVREAQRGSYQKYVYQDGVYQIYSDDMFKGAIKAFVNDYDPMLLKMGTIDEAFRQLSTDLTYIPQTALNADENLINFQNGLLDIRTMNLRPHDPAVLSTIQIPCDWTGVPAPAPVFDSYLSTLTGGNDQTQALLMEFVGAALSNVPGHRMKKALFLHGPGDTGKSQLKRLVEKLLGFGNYTGIDMAQMEARFGTSSIYGKRLAGSSDMSFMTVSELKVFKRATGGDTLFAEFKGQDSFEFVYSGLLWFCMNELPKFGGDDGPWVFDRMATAQAGSIADDPAKYQFECWVVQKWNGTEFVDTEVEVYPGDTFEVLKANAKEEDIEPTQDNPNITKKYTVQLRAKYKPKEDPTPTHIDWYKNYKEGGKHEAFHQDLNKKINEPVTIQSALTREGYSFIGWARVDANESNSHTPEGATKPVADVLPFLGSSQLYIKWEDGKFWAKNKQGVWVEVTYVAADEVTPYHDMYAVWVKDYPITVQKKWDNTDGFTDFIPKTVKVEVLKNGKSLDPKVTITLTKNDDGTWPAVTTEQEFPAFDANGNEIHYTVSEESINGWKLEGITYGDNKEYVNQDNYGTTVEVTNTLVNGSITLNKTISGLPDALVSELNNLEFYVKGPKQEDNTYKKIYGPYKLSAFTQSDGTYSISPDDLKFVEPGEYICYERNADLLTDWGYELTPAPGTTETSPVTFTLNEGDTASDIIANAYERAVGDLVIKKTVEGDQLPAEYAEDGGKFPYTVKIQNSKGWWLKGTGTATDKYDLTNVETEAGSYKITKTGPLRLENIPIGTYTVFEQGTEQNGSAWIENYELTVGYTTNPVVVPKKTTDQNGIITIINTYTKQVGTLSVSKVTDPTTISKSFEFTVKNSNGKYLKENTETGKYDFQDEPFVFTAPANGDSKKFVDIPVDTYTVEEVIDGTTPGDKANVQVEGYRYDGTSYSPDDGLIEVSKTTTESSPAAVTITNSYTKLVPVTVTKVLEDNEGAKEAFTFTASLMSGTGNTAIDITEDYLDKTYSVEVEAGKTAEDNEGNVIPAGTDIKVPVGSVLTVTETGNSAYKTEVSVAGADAEETLTGILNIVDIDTTNTNTTNTNTITFTNTRKEQLVSIWKTDMDYNSLTGASFALYKKDDYEPDAENANPIELPNDGTVGSNGILTLGNLALGTYILVETQAPAGYNTADSAITINVATDGVTASQGLNPADVEKKGDEHWVEGQDDATWQIRVWNTPGVALPATGGPGTRLFTILGSILILGAGILLWRRRRLI